jgi:hypothetical protein
MITIKELTKQVNKVTGLLFITIGLGAVFWNILLLGVDKNKGIELFMTFLLTGSIVIFIGIFFDIIIRIITEKNEYSYIYRNIYRYNNTTRLYDFCESY